MFPDFLKTKEKLKKRLDYETKKARLSYIGPLADVPVSMVFEGNKTVFAREDGSIQEVKMEKSTVKLEIKLAEVEKMNHDMVINKVSDLGGKMAEQEAKLFYEQIIKSAEEVGNVDSTDGKPFSVDLLFNMLEKIDIDFDEEGNPSGLTFVANSKMSPSIAKLFAQVEADPRYQEIIERKREEWRARESNRKLVG